MDEPRLDNPYASPQAEESSGDAPSWDAWNDAGLVVTPPKSELPMRCFVCNAPAGKEKVLRRTGWVSLRGIFNISITWYLCENHRQRWFLEFLGIDVPRISEASPTRVVLKGAGREFADSLRRDD